MLTVAERVTPPLVVSHADECWTPRRLNVFTRHRLQSVCIGRIVYRVLLLLSLFFLNLGRSSRGGRQKFILEIITLVVNYYYYYYYFLAHQHKACRQLKIKQEMTAVGD